MHARSISELYEPLARGRKANSNLKITNEETKTFLKIKTSYICFVYLSASI